jgi:hypothetical protein
VIEINKFQWIFLAFTAWLSTTRTNRLCRPRRSRG